MGIMLWDAAATGGKKATQTDKTANITESQY